MELYMEEPLLRGRLHIAYPMISFMQHPKGEEYLYNFFLNLECHKENRDLNFCYVSQLDQKNISWIHYLNTHHCYLDFLNEKKMDIHEALKDELEKSNYIYLAFDDFYLPFKAKEPVHKIHINMIYGMDTKKKIYRTVGYDEKGQFKKIPLPFPAVAQGLGSPVVEVFHPDKKKAFHFNRELFLLQIKDFLNAENNMVSAEALALDNINKEDFIYGIAVYERILEHLKEVSDGEFYDLRNLYQLFEWSMLNRLRMQFLFEEKICGDKETTIQKTEKCYEESRVAHMLMLKYSCNRDVSIVRKVSDLVKQHRQDSIMLYREMEKIVT